jgi:hypothetical protein
MLFSTGALQGRSHEPPSNTAPIDELGDLGVSHGGSGAARSSCEQVAALGTGNLRQSMGRPGEKRP